MYKAREVDCKYETKKIIIEVPKNLRMLTAVMVYDVDDKPGLFINTKTYGTSELAELEATAEGGE